MNEINKDLTGDQALIYHGMMINKPIAFVGSGEWEGWLMAQNHDGQWVSLNEIPNYKEMKQLIKNLNHQIRDMDLTIGVKLSAIKSLNNRIDELEDLIHHRLGRRRCAHCEKVFDNSDTDEIVHDHFMTCEKSPVAIALKNANELNQGLAEGMDLAIDALRAARNTIQYYTRTELIDWSNAACQDCGAPVSCEHKKDCSIKETLIKINKVIDLDSSLPIRVNKNYQILCAYCRTEFNDNQRDELANHIMTCEKSPLVQCVKSQKEAIDLLIANVESLIANMPSCINSFQKAGAVYEANEALKLIKSVMNNDDNAEIIVIDESKPDGENK